LREQQLGIEAKDEVTSTLKIDQGEGTSTGAVLEPEGKFQCSTGKVSMVLTSPSLSPPRRSRSKSKSKHFSTGMSAKWWAIIPLTLELMYKFSEPKGGWEQYHATNHNLEQRIKEYLNLPFLYYQSWH
jgi:hypothetical protein